MNPIVHVHLAKYDPKYSENRKQAQQEHKYILIELFVYVTVKPA